MQTSDISEKGLEAIIQDYLTAYQGYVTSHSNAYDRAFCLNKTQLLDFIKATQPNTYTKIQQRGEKQFIKRLAHQIRQKGIIHTLRKGIKDLNHHVDLYYKKPTSHLNTQAHQQYAANIFAVTRQLYYSQKNKNSLDMVILINGLPIITFELKNQYTRQRVTHAIHQYQKQRDPKEPLFAFGRCIVHFALDTDLVYMTTHLQGMDTRFLPFNKGHNHGAGNPVNPQGLKVDYLWKDILSKESLSNILENYVQMVTEQNQDTGKTKRKLIFPRYHQLHAVSKLLQHAKQHGVGQRYLIQHSAGSGKSNSITWLAHQLVSLHDTQHTAPIFDSVVVVTDRHVLDKQIKDNIKQFSQVKSVVEPIEKSKDLKQALEDGKKIIITTVQKFPFIMDEIGRLRAKKFAIIIDEAHSSQSGETASKMNWVLAEPPATYGEAKEYPTSEDLVNNLIEQRKMIKNGSYFAFTATPKNKTLETFGTKVAEGKFRAFDHYAMKQAIEEKFILDVLNNYTTYQSYYKLNKAVEDNPAFETRQANKKLKAYVEIHRASIEAKAEVMLEHFDKNTCKQIKGKAKAMVVCKSIESAIRYYQAFTKYLQQINSPYKAIIAFSGTKELDGIAEDEAKLNGFPSHDIPKIFKKQEYRFLIVANKFQTGFDEPLLHTMYVDKKLASVQAVQTLSRLNRARPDKKDTFVMDFFNTIDDIKKAFEPFYTTTILSEATDANKLNDLQNELDEAQVYAQHDVNNFTDLYFNKADRENLDPIIDRSVGEYRELDEQEQRNFYKRAKSFCSIYAFLSKLLSFNNLYWERLYWFLKLLMPKIQHKDQEDLAKGILEKIALDSYRLTRTTQENITLQGDKELDPIPSTIRGGKNNQHFNELDSIINEFNTKFGLHNWTDNDKIKNYLFTQLPEEIKRDKTTINAIKYSDKQNAKITSDKKVGQLMQKAIFEHSDLYKKFTDNIDFKREYLNFVFDKIWQQHNNPRTK